MIAVEEARKRILERMLPLGAELVGLDQTLGRVLAEDLVATQPVPRFTNSAMDGYALHSRVTDRATANEPLWLDVIGESAAGGTGELVVTRQEAARIFTGAPLPKGCDAVVMQEDAIRDGERVGIKAPVSPRQHVRGIGEDIDVGAALLSRGAVVGAGEAAIAAIQGRAFLSVVRRPRVAIVPTGDELVEIDALATAAPTKVPNSNALMLAMQVAEAGGQAVRLPITADSPDAIADALTDAATTADIIITSGGVSVGDHDYVARVLESHGAIAFHKVAMRPGKPLAFGAFGTTPFFGLPGNPVSSFVSFELFVRPALRVMLGARDSERPLVSVKLAAAVKRATDRRSYVRTRLARDGNMLIATPSSRQGSGDLTSLAAIDGLLIIEAGPAPVAEGTHVPCSLLRLI